MVATCPAPLGLAEVVAQNGCMPDEVFGSDVSCGYATLEDCVVVCEVGLWGADGSEYVEQVVTPPVEQPFVVEAHSAVAVAVPHLEPVLQAGAMSPPAPVQAPAPQPTPVPTPLPAEVVPAAPLRDATPAGSPLELPTTPAVPRERNIFEEVDELERGGEAASQPSAADAIPAETPPAGSQEAEARSAGTAAGTDSAPAVPEAGDAAHRRPREPLRRWIDRSGSRAMVGSLREVRDGACLIDSPQRSIMVPLEQLSEFDRAYVARAAARLERSAAPEAAATAGF
ncbi:MAG: hypothetical protein ACKO4T_10905 [Planctomycetaceae bacterium]